MKRLIIIGVILVIAVVAATIGLHAWWLHNAPPEERRSFVWSGSFASSAGPIKVDLVPDLADAGVTCEYVSTRSESYGRGFLRVEKRSVELNLATGQRPLAGTVLKYELFDKNSHSLGFGRILLDQPLGARESRTITLADVRTTDAWHIIISREGAK